MWLDETNLKKTKISVVNNKRNLKRIELIWQVKNSAVAYKCERIPRIRRRLMNWIIRKKLNEDGIRLQAPLTKEISWLKMTGRMYWNAIMISDASLRPSKDPCGIEWAKAKALSGTLTYKHSHTPLSHRHLTFLNLCD